MLTAAQISTIAGHPFNENMKSVLSGLSAAGQTAGLVAPHRVACYIAQLAHETAGFRYDREVWGPSPAQKRYEGRADIGNTQAGDGFKFRGRTGIQITGRANTLSFWRWCQDRFPSVPDFIWNPDAMNTDPWEGLGPIWYWDSRALNRYADEGNHEMITRRINGGLNGYEDRLRWFSRASLVMLGFGPTEVRKFQVRHQKNYVLGDIDGLVGPKTRAAMLAELKKITTPAAQSASPFSALLALLNSLFGRKVTA